MKILIVGAGDVGFSLAQRLSAEHQDVTIIEQDPEKIAYLNERVDVMTLHGNGASIRLLEQADIAHTSLLIAVTNRDEVNMLTCLLAREYNVPVKIARISNPDYSLDIPHFLKKQMGIDLIINPHFQVADEIARILRIPEASDVARFANGRIQLIGIPLNEADKIIGMKIKDFFELKKLYSFLIVAIERGQRIIIPSGEDELSPQDLLYIIAETAIMPELLGKMGKKVHTIEHLMIIGGGKIGSHLAKQLESSIPRIKIVEQDGERCEQLSEQFDKTVILHADASDMETLFDEGIAQVEAMVTATSIDQTNVLMSLLGKHLGIRKIVAIVNDERYMSMLTSLGIDTVINPKQVTADTILKYVRRGRVLSVASIGGEKAEILEVEISSHSPMINRPLKELDLPNGCIVGAIQHVDDVIIPTGNDIIRQGDKVIVFSLRSLLPKIEKLFV